MNFDRRSVGNDASPASKPVPALRNAVRIIEAINEHPSGSMSLAELSVGLGITKSHCHAILKTLTHAGWLRFNEREKTYRLAAGLLASCSSLLVSPDLERIRERLNLLVRKSGFSCVLSQPQPDGSFIVVDNLANNNPMLVSYAIGARLPSDSPAQMRAHLAWRPAEVQKAWIARWTPHPYTRRTIITRDALERELAATRRRGYSRSVGEHFDGMLAYGLPIFGRDGNVLYIFCLAGFVQQAEAVEEAVTEAMKQAVREIHDAILGAPPADFLTGR